MVGLSSTSPCARRRLTGVWVKLLWSSDLPIPISVLIVAEKAPMDTAHHVFNQHFRGFKDEVEIHARFNEGLEVSPHFASDEVDGIPNMVGNRWRPRFEVNAVVVVSLEKLTNRLHQNITHMLIIMVGLHHMEGTCDRLHQMSGFLGPFEVVDAASDSGYKLFMLPLHGIPPSRVIMG